jgi:hypothetical protein
MCTKHNNNLIGQIEDNVHEVKPRPINYTKVTITVLPDGRVSAKNAARFLGISDSTLRNQRWKGGETTIPFITINRRVWYYFDDLQAAVDRPTVTSTSQEQAMRMIEENK